MLLVLPHAVLGGYLQDLTAPDPAALPPALTKDCDQIRRIIRVAGSTTICLGTRRTWWRLSPCCASAGASSPAVYTWDAAAAGSGAARTIRCGCRCRSDTAVT
jgi:hypothetical protein